MLIMSYDYAFAVINNRTRPEVFPNMGLFMAGSRTTFCCVLPAGEIFDKMYLTGYSSTEMNTTEINNQTYALTVDLKASNNVCTNVKCRAMSTKDNGACASIGCKYDLVFC